jgi:hypothetical protein
MKTIALVLYALLFFEPAPVSVEKWVIEKNSSMTIEGRTNINTFQCDIVEYLNRDTLLLYKDNSQSGKPITTKGALTINVNHFDCHQSHITADFKKTLKADKNSHMKINLLSLGYIKPNMPAQTVKGWVEIQLAGVVRKMEIDYAVLAKQAGHLQLTGTKKVTFADFKMDPPKKLAGLIRVEQEIGVRFHLALRFAGAKPG